MEPHWFNVFSLLARIPGSISLLNRKLLQPKIKKFSVFSFLILQEGYNVHREDNLFLLLKWFFIYSRKISYYSDIDC